MRQREESVILTIHRGICEEKAINKPFVTSQETSYNEAGKIESLVNRACGLFVAGIIVNACQLTLWISIIYQN